MSNLEFDCVIVGAGVVGVSCARELAERGRSVLVLDRAARAGTETSSRNSGVVHAGLYYPPTSLKAQTCIEGRQRLYERCRKQGVPHRKLGKLVVAVDASEEPQLEALYQRAQSNGVPIHWLERGALAQRAPQLNAHAALWSPESGIVDAHALVEAHRRAAIASDAVFCFRSAVHAFERQVEGWTVMFLDAAGSQQRVHARVVVNAGGLHAAELCAKAGIDVARAKLATHWCKGDYFALPARKVGLGQLVYPLPTAAGLGIHLTVNLSGEVFAGPDAFYVDKLDYAIEPDKAAEFFRAVDRYWPGLQPSDFRPAHAGIRPKLQGPGEAFRDFVVEDMAEHGAPGFIALAGIESPGLTAAEALAHRVETSTRHYL